MMRAFHWLFGLSDAFLAATPPGEIEAHTFNLIMVLVFFIGITGFIAHAIGLAIQRGGGRWFLGKLVALAVYWILVVNIL
ncbi:hypothetical protein GC207_06685 [bacterium]|nr:hypothetical protein [bacterium]